MEGATVFLKVERKRGEAERGAGKRRAGGGKCKKWTLFLTKKAEGGRIALAMCERKEPET